MASSDDEVFRQIVQEALPGRMVTNFVLIAEVIDDEYEHLSLFTSERMTSWLAKGMLKSAEEMISEAEYAEYGEED
jgi:hypothetical protein